MKDYFEFELLKHVYFEDSFVNTLLFESGKLKMYLDLVLLESHEKYSPPKPDEQYCYISAILSFYEMTHVEWNCVRMFPSLDADGRTGMGNIDSMRTDGVVFEIEGGWGSTGFRCQR